MLEAIDIWQALVRMRLRWLVILNTTNSFTPRKCLTYSWSEIYWFLYSKQSELERLMRNKARRELRENQKKKLNDPTAAAISPSSTPAPATEKQTGTTRKCANCGQAGHIKTNKKYCYTCSLTFGSFSKSRRWFLFHFISSLSSTSPCSLSYTRIWCFCQD